MQENISQDNLLITGQRIKYNFLLAIVCFLILPRAWSSSMQASLKTQGETLNFEITGQKNWDYDIKKVKDGKLTKVQLMVKGLDENSTSRLKLSANPFVKNLKILPKTIEGLTTIEFQLADDTVDAFDYLTDQPSKLVVDFYKNDEIATESATNDSEITAKLAKSKSKKVDKNTIKAESAKSADLLKVRKPAQAEFLKVEDDNGILTFIDQDVNLRNGLFDGGDDKFRRFKIKQIEIQQDAIIKGLANYYLRFPMLNQEMTFWTAMKNTPPEYTILPKDSDENKQARLLKTLFVNNRPLVLKKTTDWFEKKYPRSQYLEQAYYMNADAALASWKKSHEEKDFQTAIQFYNKAMDQFPDSPLKERTSLFTGFLYLDKSDYLSAARKLTSHIENPKFKGRPSQDYAKLGLAFSLLKANNLEDALKLLDDVEAHAKNDVIKAEASYRKGDFYFHQGKLDLAVEAYDKAFAKYEKYSQLFPNAHFNKMEALFRLKKPELAHTEALDFVQRYPAHDYAPYALTRVGELLEVLGADQSKSIGAFLETHFRYGDNPKTVIARLHLLSTRMKSMKEQEVVETIKKMDDLGDKSDLEDVQQFKATMIADGFSRRKEFKKAIDVLTQFYQKEPNKPDSFQVTLRIVKNIAEQIKDFSDKNDFMSVLKNYKNYADSWLKTQPRIDVNYHVAHAYQSAGSCSTALKKYDKVLSQIAMLKDDALSKAIRANQEIPSFDSINLKIAQCLYEENKFQESYTQIQKITKPDQLSEQEQVDRVHYAALLYEQKGDVTAAIRYLTELTKVWKDKPELLAPSLIHLSDLEIKRKQPALAMSYLEQLTDAKTMGKIKDNYVISAHKKLAEIATNQKKTDIALKTLAQLLENYEGKVEGKEDLSTERFKLGELYFNNGEIKKAEKVWADFKGKESGFWTQLAQNKLKDANWREENNRYIKRIPAMSKSDLSNSEKNPEASK